MVHVPKSSYINLINELAKKKNMGVLYLLYWVMYFYSTSDLLNGLYLKFLLYCDHETGKNDFSSFKKSYKPESWLDLVVRKANWCIFLGCVLEEKWCILMLCNIGGEILLNLRLIWILKKTWKTKVSSDVIFFVYVIW